MVRYTGLDGKLRKTCCVPSCSSVCVFFCCFFLDEELIG